VKCAFGLLKKKINILVIYGRSYSQCTLKLIMRACIILQNMIIDDERDDSYDDNYHTITSIIAPPVNYEAPASLTILQRETHLTSGLMFLNFLIRLDQACVEQVPLDHFYLIIIQFFNLLCNFYF
jgi:hypothetical protein